jgi:hypothetical protein
VHCDHIAVREREPSPQLDRAVHRDLAALYQHFGLAARHGGTGDLDEGAEFDRPVDRDVVYGRR